MDVQNLLSMANTMRLALSKASAEKKIFPDAEMEKSRGSWRRRLLMTAE